MNNEFYNLDIDCEFDRPKEECGVLGIYDPDKTLSCSELAYYGLYALQHRGQESCGIVTNDNKEIFYKKGMGLVNEVFNDKNLAELTGNIAVGHVRYSTAGGSRWENTQPLVSRYIKGTLVIAHNGNLTNAAELHREYETTGAIFQTTTDSEVIAYALARARLFAPSIENALSMAMNHIKGAYSLVIMSPEKLIGVRDPLGMRPLSIGKLDNAYIFVSETCALDAIGAEFVRDVEPGEIVVIGKKGLTSYREHCGQPSRTCIFEYIYFARPDSTISNQSVYEARTQAGRILAQESPVDADVVIAVPDSGISAAIGYAEASGIPYGHGLIKNRYIGRTFIQPKQSQRETSVRIKLNPLKATVAGKRVVMIDDSIVRGTTASRIVKMLKEAGAKEVHVRVSSPPFMYPCFFGTDISSRKYLVACHHTLEETRQLLGADSLAYLSVDALKKIVPNATCGFCDACFTGNYPIPVPSDANN
jgi:amidophosphoribosyltransferase